MKYDNNNKYLQALKDPNIKHKMIMKELTFPNVVYKYKSFGKEKNGEWKEFQYWKSTMEGDSFFSLPEQFNSNDPKDCIIEINYEKFVRVNFPGVAINKNKIGKAKGIFEDYTRTLQHTARVGCFTDVSPLNNQMWDNKHFGSNGEGYCIEYNVKKEFFYPSNIIFLKVVYEGRYDATDLMISLAQNITKNPPISLEDHCLAYNPFLFKPYDYKEEHEWRMIIPQNRYNDYFDNPDESIKKMASIINAIYLGPNYKRIPGWEEKRAYAISVASKNGFSIFEMKNKNLNELEAIKIY